MLTQCPACRTVFRVAAPQLRQAAGRVRCGNCSNPFSALELPIDEDLIEALSVDVRPGAREPSIGRDGVDPPAEIENLHRRGAVDGAAESEPARLDIRVDDDAAYQLFDKMPAQIAWFNQGIFFTYFPEVRPKPVDLCARSACTLTDLRPPPSYKVLARDVREHPRYTETLLVNATLLNDTQILYPLLELSLYDPPGR